MKDCQSTGHWFDSICSHFETCSPHIAFAFLNLEDAVKATSPFYLMSTTGEVKRSPAGGKCETCRGLGVVVSVSLTHWILLPVAGVSLSVRVMRHTK